MLVKILTCSPFSTESAEREIMKLRREIEEIENSVKVDPDIVKLETQNNKLKYQVRLNDVNFQSCMNWPVLLSQIGISVRYFWE